MIDFIAHRYRNIEFKIRIRLDSCSDPEIKFTQSYKNIVEIWKVWENINFRNMK